MAALFTSAGRVGPAVGLTRLPMVSHQAVHDVPRASTDAGLVHRIQQACYAGAGTLERYNGANFSI